MSAQHEETLAPCGSKDCAGCYLVETITLPNGTEQGVYIHPPKESPEWLKWRAYWDKKAREKTEREKAWKEARKEERQRKKERKRKKQENSPSTEISDEQLKLLEGEDLGRWLGGEEIAAAPEAPSEDEMGELEDWIASDDPKTNTSEAKIERWIRRENERLDKQTDF